MTLNSTSNFELAGSGSFLDAAVCSILPRDVSVISQFSSLKLLVKLFGVTSHFTELFFLNPSF